MDSHLRPLEPGDAEQLAELARRVEAGTMAHNLASRAVLTRNGFAQFGYAQRYLAIAGAYADHLLFQRLAD